MRNTIAKTLLFVGGYSAMIILTYFAFTENIIAGSVLTGFCLMIVGISILD